MSITVEGIVVEGDHRGRELGFPTANVESPGTLSLPGDGVYAGRAKRADGTSYLAAISIGKRPTYYGEEAPRLVEAHLLDFDDDLYGELLVLSVGEFVRAQVRFSSTEELVEQMQRDVAVVRETMADELSA